MNTVAMCCRLALIFGAVLFASKVLNYISGKMVARLDGQLYTLVVRRKTDNWCAVGRACEIVGMVALSCGLTAIAVLLMYVR